MIIVVVNGCDRLYQPPMIRFVVHCGNVRRYQSAIIVFDVLPSVWFHFRRTCLAFNCVRSGDIRFVSSQYPTDRRIERRKIAPSERRRLSKNQCDRSRSQSNPPCQLPNCTEKVIFRFFGQIHYVLCLRDRCRFKKYWLLVKKVRIFVLPTPFTICPAILKRTYRFFI